MKPEERALKIYPVKYQRDTDRKNPDLNAPLRKAWLDGYHKGFEEGFEEGVEE